MLQIPKFIFAGPHQQTPFPLTLFIHGFILRTFGFIVRGGSPLRPFMSNGKEGGKRRKS